MEGGGRIKAVHRGGGGGCVIEAVRRGGGRIEAVRRGGSRHIHTEQDVLSKMWKRWWLIEGVVGGGRGVDAISKKQSSKILKA